MINNNIIGFFPRINRIGIGNRYGLFITLTGTNSTVMDLIYHNLLKIPFTVCFKGAKTISLTLLSLINTSVLFINMLLKFKKT